MIMPEQNEAQLIDALETALKHYQDPAWLGANSPLAAVYFLGERLTADASTALARGRALQHLLATAAAAITGDYADRYQTILREYYFHDRAAAVVWDLIGLSKNSFHLSRNAAIAALEAVLISRLQPALRLEQPPLPTELVERESVTRHCQTLLTMPKSVAIQGPGGIGKTALAAQIAQTSARPIFWYTVRPGLNDQPVSLLFALALFAHRHGVSTLWLALVTNPRQPIDEQMLSALRYVLTQIAPAPLLCIDGLELLQPVTLAHHQALAHCLDSLRGLVAILLLGQQMPLDADEYLTVSGLSAAGVSQLLLQQAGQAPSSLRAELYRLTHGNPRLLKLSLAALANGETPADLQRFLSTSAALDRLFGHTIVRLSAAERQLLMALSVLRSPAPLTDWQSKESAMALAALQRQGLLQIDQQGAAELPAIYRELLLQQMDAATTRTLHAQAAQQQSRRGAYTTAAYHWVEAGRPEAALALWRAYQDQEIAQGQAATALTLFRHVRRLDLPAAAQEQATLFCAQLEQFTGYAEEAATTVRTLLSKTPILAVEGAELTGIIANDRSDFERASAAFQRALQIAELLVEVRMGHLYKGRAWMHLRQREVAQAEQALQRAEFEVANMRGNLALDRGQYEAAAGYYQAALQQAEALDLPEAVGKCTTNLGGVALFQGHFADAIRHLTRAGVAYARIGKVAAQAGSQITLAVAYNQAGDHKQALTVLAEAEQLLSSHGPLQPWQQALLAQARAEAYLGLGDWAATEDWVQMALAAEEVSVLPDSYRVYGELCTQRGAYDEAKRFLQQSRELAEANEDRYLAAYAWRALARLYRAMGDDTQAAATRTTAIALFEAMNLVHEVEQC